MLAIDEFPSFRSAQAHHELKHRYVVTALSQQKVNGLTTINSSPAQIRFKVEIFKKY